MLARSFKKPLKYISALDPAVDRSTPEAIAKAEKYAATGDPQYLQLVEGATPSVFELAPLTQRQFDRCVMIDNGYYRCKEAVAYALLSVTAVTYEGVDVRIDHDKVDGERRVKPETLEKVFPTDSDGFTLYMEIGSRVLSGVRLDPTKG